MCCGGGAAEPAVSSGLTGSTAGCGALGCPVGCVAVGVRIRVRVRVGARVRVAVGVGVANPNPGVRVGVRVRGSGLRRGVRGRAEHVVHPRGLG